MWAALQKGPVSTRSRWGPVALAPERETWKFKVHPGVLVPVPVAVTGKNRAGTGVDTPSAGTGSESPLRGRNGWGWVRIPGLVKDAVFPGPHPRGGFFRNNRKNQI